MTRTAVFVDNSNVFRNIRRMRQISPNLIWPTFYDPLALARAATGGRHLSDVYFYCVPPPEWLLFEGGKSRERYVVTTKYYAAVGKLPNVEVKQGYLRGGKDSLIEKNVDTQFAVDMVSGAAFNAYDVAILVSNDGDYTSAIQSAAKLGKRVEVIFFGGRLSSSLRDSCDLARRARRSWFQPLQM